MIVNKSEKYGDGDFELLVDNANVGFFQSCEITQLYLIRKDDGAIINFYILASFEEKPYSTENHQYLGELISVNKDFSVGIQRYILSIPTAKSTYYKLAQENKWQFRDNESLKLERLVKIRKQFVPGNDQQRLSRILKNNFYNGSYIIEFFDESKSLSSCLSSIEKLSLLNQVSEKIKDKVPIDLSLVRDRIGNIIFQFPVTLVDLRSRAMASWDGLIIRFKWHPKLMAGKAFLIQTDSTMDKNYMGASIVKYDGSPEQGIVTGNISQISHLKLWSEAPNLLLSVFDGTYLRGIGLNMSIGHSEPRIFMVDGKEQKVQISSKEIKSGDIDVIDYTTHITNTLYDAEKESLENRLAFKQYFKGDTLEAIEDLRVLIKQHDKNGVYLWDPYLRSKDILNTLYYSETAGVVLRAVGAIDPTSKKVYGQKGITSESIISLERDVLDNIHHNNHGLNLEFRIQYEDYGWDFHDRFLIFPGGRRDRPKVYSIGTSINSVGNSHHILQEVSHPQRVIDAFNELWTKLSNKNCLVWKSR
jgi:hypothetical protein